MEFLGFIDSTKGTPRSLDIVIFLPSSTDRFRNRFALSFTYRCKMKYFERWVFFFCCGRRVNVRGGVAFLGGVGGLRGGRGAGETWGFRG